MILRQLGKLMTKKLLGGALLGAMLSALIVIGCASGAGPDDEGNPGVPPATQAAVDREGGDSSSEQGVSAEDGENGSQDNGEHGSAAEARGSSEEEGEHRPNGEDSQDGGEHRAGREGTEGSGEQGPAAEGSRESNEAAMSSPIIPLSQSWSGVLGGLAVSMQYDEATRTVHGTVQNTLSEKLCYVQAEPHIKSGTRTVGELGPEKLGDLNPGQETISSLDVASEPELAGVSYDGYVVHMEVFDCSGPGPSPHSEGGGSEGGGEHGRGEEGGHEGSGEHGRDGESAGEEGGDANYLAPDETLEMTGNGTRLVLSYDAAGNTFTGTVENTTEGVLERVRVEVHLSNGTELGPTTPTGMAPGELIAINLPATEEPFAGWTAHAEAGGGGEGESGGEHREGGEHGEGGESGGEHGSVEENGGRD